MGIEMRYPLIAITLTASLLSICAVASNYARPTITMPRIFRAPEPLRPPQAASLADLKWLTRTALEQNYDLRDAVARVEQARANLGITRSNQLSQFSAGGALQVTRLSRDGQTPLPVSLVREHNRNWG